MDDISKHIFSNKLSIKQAVRNMDLAGIGFCVCVDDNKNVLGVMTDGDFRRAVLDGMNLDSSVENIINKEFTYLSPSYSKDDVKEIFKNSIVKHIPVLEDNKLIDIILYEPYADTTGLNLGHGFDNPVIIMAGGKGTRMDPFTRILPKALIPFGKEPILKIIMDEFSKYGVNNFFISLNNKGEMIKAYFHELDPEYNLQYLEEDMPLGTAGAIKFSEAYIKQPFFVSNCDIFIRTDYSSVIDFHEKNKYDLTLVASMRHHVIPYGVCDIQQNGELIQINEKPEYDYLVNTGLYLMNPCVFKYIPKNTYFDMTDLISVLKENNLKIGVFPVSEKSWYDIGQWSEYKSSISNLPAEFSL